MTRRIALLTIDSNFENFVKISALTLTKLNYQVDIFKEIKKDIDLVIIDFDNPENMDVMKSVRKDITLKNKKVVGVISEKTDKINQIFESGCDSLMTKKEFEVAGNNILMY
ncbi:MAG: hypothetical protein NTU73_13265 [Ignavibacteriae bacterium]|nr:hypothetical protein [Ignavibacteriota bacterium]